MLTLPRHFVLSLLAISVCAAQPLRVVAALGDAPVFVSAHAFAFLQAREGIRLVSLTEAPPAAILLPANELAELPSVGALTRFGRQSPTAGQSPEEFCSAPSFDFIENCEAWLIKATERRRLLTRLVSRRFELRGGSKYVETLSVNAARQLTASDRALSPHGAPLLGPRGPAVSSSGFDLLIPWEALPPQSSLRMESVSLHIVKAGGAGVASFAIRLAAPRHYVVSPCHLPLVALIGEYPFQELVKAFYLPQLGGQLDTVYAWKDPAVVYDWSKPALAIHQQPVQYIEAGANEWLCGPLLTYRRGAAANSNSKPGTAGLDGFTVVRLPDPSSGFLALTPPRQHHFKRFGIGGPCAGAPVVSWRLDHVVPLNELTGKDKPRVRQVLQRSVRMGCDEEEPIDYEVEFSPDLLTATEYEGHSRNSFSPDLAWRARPLKWKDGGYKEGLWEDSPPPVSSAKRRNPH